MVWFSGLAGCLCLWCVAVACLHYVAFSYDDVFPWFHTALHLCY